MKKTPMLIGAIAGACMCVGFAAGTKWSPQPQDAAQGQEMTPEMQKAMEEAYMAYGAPGKHHEILAKRVGSWDATVEHWMMPGMPAATSKGTATYAAIMDGRYIFQEYAGDSPMGPFEGGGLLAYDNLKKKYQGIWIDSMSTGIMYTEGDRKDGKVVSTGYMPDPMSGKFIPVRTTEHMPDNNTIIMEMFQPGPDGAEYRSMKITYKRQSGGGTIR